MKDEKPAKTDADIITECIARMQASATAEADNRANALDDLAFEAGDQWDPVIKAQRSRDNRPCLTINKLPVFRRQVTNSQRQNKPSIKVHPVSDEDTEVAEIIQGAIRHLEYVSKASVCYDTATSSAAQIGFGYFRLVTGYCEDNSFDQEIRFQRIRNPFTVYFDPASVEIDGSDAQWCVMSIKVPRGVFAADFPKAEPVSVDQVRALGDGASDWVDEGTIRVAEYYRINRVPAKVVLLSNGESGYKDELQELPLGVVVVDERDSVKAEVQWFKLTAAEILDRATIPCKWIPVFPVYGDELDIDGKVIRSGMIRNAKDPARMYNYWITAATEQVALVPKAPYIGAEGQFEGHESEWAQANTSNFPFLEYKPTALGAHLAPAPQRQPFADIPSGIMAMAAHANDDIKATTGIFDASLGAKSNETSGIAIKRRDQQGETSNFHFIDNLHTTLRHVGRCIVNMWPRVYDGQRTLRIMGEDGKVTAKQVNRPIPPMEQKPDPKTGAIAQIENDMTVGEFDVVVGVGPAYDTMRQEAVEGMIQTAQSWPKLMDIAGDKVVRSMDWPMADAIADRIAKTIPQELKSDEDKDGADQQAVPPEVQQMLAQYEAAVKDLMAQVHEAKSGMDKAKLQAQTSVQVAQINADAAQDREELKGMISLLLQKLQPPPVLAAEVAEDLGEEGQEGTA